MISGAAVLLWGVAAFLGTIVLAIAVSRHGSATRLIYGATLGISGFLSVLVVSHLAGDPEAQICDRLRLSEHLQLPEVADRVNRA